MKKQKSLVTKAQKEVKTLRTLLAKEKKELKTTNWKTVEKQWVAEAMKKFVKEAREDIKWEKQDQIADAKETEKELRKAERHLAVVLKETK